jgi:hypothetical protein
MVNFGDVGIICVNRDLQGECRNCLWREWDSRLQCCCNGQSPICARYRERLLSAGRPSRFRQEVQQPTGLPT